MPRRQREEPQLWGRVLGEPDMTQTLPRRGFEWLELGDDNPIKAVGIGQTGTCLVRDPHGDPADEPHEPFTVMHTARQHGKYHLANVHKREEARRDGKPVPPYSNQKTRNDNSLQLLAVQLNVTLGQSLGSYMPVVTGCAWEGRHGDLCGFNVEANLERMRPVYMESHLDTHQRALEDHGVDFFCYICGPGSYGTNDRDALRDHISERHGEERETKYNDNITKDNCNVWAQYLARKAMIETPEAADWSAQYAVDFHYDHTADWELPSDRIYLPHFRHA